MYMNITDTTKQMISEFEKKVYQYLDESIEWQKGRTLDEDDIDFSKMFIFATEINANWLPQIAPVSYGIVGDQVYSFVPDSDGEIVCEQVCLWD